MLARLIPTALRRPSPAALQHANSLLELEIAERKRAEAEVRHANDLLEARVAERTRELEVAYQTLRQTQQASMQQERLRALGRMASGIAHDINNALTPAIEVDSETYEVRIDGVLITCEPASVLPMAQRYFLF